MLFLEDKTLLRRIFDNLQVIDQKQRSRSILYLGEEEKEKGQMPKPDKAFQILVQHEKAATYLTY